MTVFGEKMKRSFQNSKLEKGSRFQQYLTIPTPIDHQYNGHLDHEHNKILNSLADYCK